MNKRELQRTVLLLDERLNAPRQCFSPGCTRTAINSHVLQRKGVLSEIAQEGYVMERSSSTPFQPRRLSRQSVKNSDVLAFVGFCEQCDKEIFKEIEVLKPDFKNYRHLLLFAYRGHVCAMHRRRAYYETAELITNDILFSAEVRRFAGEKILGFMIGDMVAEQYKLSLEDCLFHSVGKMNFSFTQFTLPRVDIVASTCFAFPIKISTEVIREMSIDNSYEDFVRYADPGLGFINLFPVKDKLIFSYGYNPGATNNGIPMHEVLAFVEQESLYKFISDILIKHTEIWAVSIPFYKKLKEIGQYDKLLKNLNFYENIDNRHIGTDFNIFDGMY